MGGENKKIPNEEPDNLYSSQNIIWAIKSRRKWVGHVIQVGR
jgi:hypothetical protein